MIQYSPVNLVIGANTALINAYPDTQVVVVYNESSYFLSLNFVGSGSGVLAAYTADCFPVYNGFTGTIQVNASQYLQTPQGSNVGNQLYIQSYGSTDSLAKNVQSGQSTGYPISLSRSINNITTGQLQTVDGELIQSGVVPFQIAFNGGSTGEFSCSFVYGFDVTTIEHTATTYTGSIITLKHLAYSGSSFTWNGTILINSSWPGLFVRFPSPLAPCNPNSNDAGYNFIWNIPSGVGAGALILYCSL